MGWLLAVRAGDLHCVQEGREWGLSFDGQVAMSSFLPLPNATLISVNLPLCLPVCFWPSHPRLLIKY